jgi:AAHS family 4-hydroxybenzoate transporter-like MFS transporter
MEGPAQIDVAQLVDRSRVGAFQWSIFTLCSLCLIMDGFDVQAMGYVAPAIIREWQIPNYVLGPVFSAALLGVLIGSLLLSMLADKIGRRPVLIGATLYFAVLTLWTARVTSVQELLTIRFIAGIGLGCIMPNAMALAGEYAPTRMRFTVMMLVANGFNIGAAFGGFIAAALIPAFGWRSVFYFGGLVPLVLAIPMYFMLPESLQFLVLRGKHLDKVGGWLKRIGAPVPQGDAPPQGPLPQYIVHEENRKGVPLVHLFREGRALGTVLLWVINFMNLLNLYFLSSWLPTVVRDAGYSTRIAVLVGTTVQVGAVLGTFVNGWLIDRVGFRKVLTTGFGVACVSIATIGQPSLPLLMLFVVVFIAGWCVPGGQGGVNALAATYYPTYLRSTGIGSGLGIGRIGAIVGPLLASELMRRHWAARELFLAAAIPALISAVVMYSMRWAMKQPTQPVASGEALVHH